MRIHTLVAAFAVAVSLQIVHPQTSSGQTVSEPGNGVTNPILIRKVDLTAPGQAQTQKITGEVWLDVIVKADGSVDVVRVTKSPAGGTAAGLDQAAIDAAKQWIFKPGLKNGTAVPVRVVLILEVKPQQPTVYEPGQGVTNPVLVRKVDPKYSAEAMRAKITGEVWLDVVVNPDGTVNVLGVKRSLDTIFGMDDAAVNAARSWQFKPGMKGGEPVPVRVTLVMEFRMHDAPTPPTVPPNDDFANGAFKPTDPDVVGPVLVTKVEPKYTSDAMRARIDGVVQIEAIVLEDGTVDKMRIVKSLDKVYGLDENALAAAKQFVFKGGTRLGQPARFDMILTLEFRIH